MKPTELAVKYFGEYKKRGEEIVPKYCPFCEGGTSNDKYTFAMNIEGAYNCKRGSCNVSGSFWDLCEHYGEEPDTKKQHKNRNYEKKEKRYVRPNVEISEPKTKVEKYLEERGISKKTWEARGVREKDGLLAFPYYENGKMVLLKYRRPEKYNGKGAKYWQEGGGKPVLWGMDDCSADKRLVITEGEFDTLALTEAGIENVVSIPFGTNDFDWLRECWEFIEQFKKVVLWADADEAGEDFLREAVPRLGEWRCSVVRIDHEKAGDVNELLHYEGKEAVRQAIKNAEEVPIRRLVRLADVKTLDPAKMERSLSSISGINKDLGGYIYGAVSIWTGDNSAGKSTFLGQELIHCIEQNIPVMAYSGELPHGMFRYWIHLQMAGLANIKTKEDVFTGSDVYYVPREKERKMQEWYENKFLLYDHLQSTKPDDILEVFTSAAMKYGCKVYLLDNLMAVNYGGNKGEYYHRQSEFITRLIEFSDKFHCHVHVVAHPKKSDARLGKDDIAGLKEITNKAHNVIAVHRIEDKNKDQFDESVRDCDTVIEILKNRIYGKQNIANGLMFEKKCKRFYTQSNPDLKIKAYGWENQGIQEGLDRYVG